MDGRRGAEPAVGSSPIGPASSSPFPTRFVHLEAARKRFGDRVDRLGTYLTRVDTVADEAIAAMDALPKGAGARLLERAASRGVASVPEAPQAVRALLTQMEHVPLWVDWDALDRGGRLLLRAGALGGIVLGMKSLVLGYTSPAGNKPLVLSGRLQEQAGARLLETARFVQATIAPGGLRPHAPGWQATLHVRLIHARVRRMILAGDRWDSAAWGAPINQHDQAGTSLLFSAAVLQGLRQLGLRIAEPDADAYMQLWRWSSHLMGVDPELLVATEREAERLGDMIAATQAPPDEDSRSLTGALLTSPVRAAAAGPADRPERDRARDLARARRIVRFSTAMCRRLVGDTTADLLGVPRTRWRYMVPVLERIVASMEVVRENVPFADRSALWAGMRYWGRVVNRARTGAFAPPRRLPRAA